MKKIKLFRIIFSICVLALALLFFFHKNIPGAADNFPDKAGQAIVNIQILPAVLALAVIPLIIIFCVTVISGRAICSAFCPLGIYNDLISRLGSKIRKRKFNYNTKANYIKYIILSAVIIFSVFGLSAYTGLLEPFSIFGKITAYFFAPVFSKIGNVFALVINTVSGYSVPHEEHTVGILYSAIGFIFFITVTALAFFRGRFFCYALCPSGALFSLISKFSLFRMRIDETKCVSCGKCESVCPSNAISTNQIKSECVLCLNCIDTCSKDALKYDLQLPRIKKINTAGEESNSEGRKTFIKSALVITAGLLTPRIFASSNASKKMRAVPPGSISIRNFKNSCTGCSLCVSKCPTGVLSPSLFENGIDSIMQPFMNYKKAYCLYECTSCSTVCPSGAIKKLKQKEKKSVKIGEANFSPDRCIVKKENKACGACAEICPTHAIKMDSPIDGNPFPYIEAELCIGCGACEFACPANPKAFIIKPLEIHGKAKIPMESLFPIEEDNSKDFPF
ncbi:MAG: 4Fe-4S binding protein [Spirochaetes bacterium]|nr:4Fe-4S binding protein [Spirochaetota bacterium]